MEPARGTTASLNEYEHRIGQETEQHPSTCGAHAGLSGLLVSNFPSLPEQGNYHRQLEQLHRDRLPSERVPSVLNDHTYDPEHSRYGKAHQRPRRKRLTLLNRYPLHGSHNTTLYATSDPGDYNQNCDA